MNTNVRQCSISFNTKKHTLRGMHYQLPPHQEAKLVRCTQGAAHHIILDLREDSASFMKWTGIELNCDNRHSLYVPEGVAHGFITLAAATEVLYQMSVDYVPELAAGVRWNDPAFDINWPVEPVIVSDRDSSYADFDLGPN